LPARGSFIRKFRDDLSNSPKSPGGEKPEQERNLIAQEVEKAKAAENSHARTIKQGDREVLSEQVFRRRIAIERKRTERSREPFLLMLIEGNQQSFDSHVKLLNRTMAALAICTRETDVIGWYLDLTSIGVLFTGLSEGEIFTERAVIQSRITGLLHEELTNELFRQILISFHLFPDDWNCEGPGFRGDPTLYPDLEVPGNGRRMLLSAKRVVDIMGAICFLIIFSPLLLVIAVLVKATSAGSVLYRQTRVGQLGRRFTFLKFRSMYQNSDHYIHREYVSQLIAGRAERVSPDGSSEGVFKLANDQRITPLGRLLRKSSLDELPQLFNVLKGDMSLVGPRPPLPYEMAMYQTWHRCRLLHVKPGITGLWQVKGRSRLSFEEMVRLDLRYATAWSLWLDLKILLLTPGAVIKGGY
jgi:lipopolysaccharide/colanic/teichoic acid biosynthesis glycosyltransferase